MLCGGALVAVVAGAATLFVGATPDLTGLGALVAATAVLVVVIEVAARRFPVLGGAQAARVGLAVLLPLAVLQLAVVVALALLAAA